jgi:hypothetical protein
MVKPDQDAFPFEKSWLDSTVVDPRSNHCHFNYGGSRQDINKRALQWGFNGWLF